MENVVQFKLPEKSDPHASGEAVCLACKHTWTAVAPVGTAQLECPECGTERGVWKYPFSPAVGEELWQCNCGCELFYIIPDGHMCYGCGTKQVY